jgi:AcrR family transcriptional regulator
VPQQSRSIGRVAAILDAASALVVETGVEAVTTRSIATRADIPVASLYQYFADRDAILLALVERDVAAMDAQVMADLDLLSELSVRSIVSSTMRSYVTVFRKRPAFVMIWLRGRTNAAIDRFGREHNRQTARTLFDMATALGLLDGSARLLHAELCVEVGDRLFQLAFEHDLAGDDDVLEEAIDLVATSVERFATPQGLAGVRVETAR